jgi:hypothetical protein
VLDPDPHREVARGEVPDDERLPDGASGAAEREARGLDGELGGRRGAVSTKRLRSAEASRPVRAWARSAAAPATTAAAALVPLTVP